MHNCYESRYCTGWHWWENESGTYGYYKHTQSSALNAISGAFSSINNTMGARCKDVVGDSASALQKITGWTVRYQIPMVKLVLESGASTYCHTFSFGRYSHDYERTEKIATVKNGYMNGSSFVESDSFDLVDIDTSTGTYTLSNLPKGIGSILNSEFSEANATNIGGYLGELTKRANLMLNAISDLDANRPNAEIHITSDYSAAIPSDLYQSAKIPEYMVSMWWKDPAVFVKGTKFLSAVLDFDPVAIATSKFVVSTPKEIDTTVASKDTRLLNKLLDGESLSSESTWGYYYVQALDSTSTTLKYIPQYTFMSESKPTSDVVDASSVLSRHVNNFKLVKLDYPTDSKNDTLKRFVYTTDKYMITKDKSLRVNNLDTLGYLKGSFKTFTTIWAIKDNNPSKTVLPTNEWIAKLPSSVASKIITSVSSTTVGTLAPPVQANITASGDVKVSGLGKLEFTPSGNLDALTEPANVKLLHRFSSLDIGDSSKVYFYATRGSASLSSGNKYVANDEILRESTATNGLNIHVSHTPYITTAEFAHRNSGDVSPVDPLEPTSNYDPEDEHFWDNHSRAFGRYTREVCGRQFNIYPLVKRAYYNGSGALDYTYTVGSEARQINANVFYQIGLVGSATPTVVTNAPASGSMATGLANSYGAGNVTYSGAGITITYTPDVSMYFQTYALEDIDLTESYQDAWGNDAWRTQDKSAHDEWLESMGASKRNVDTGSDTEVGVWTIPYIAGAETALKASRADDWTTGKWVLDQDGAKLALADNSDINTATAFIKMYIEGGELVGIQVKSSASGASGYKNSDGDIVPVGCYTINGFSGTDDSVCTMFAPDGSHKPGTWTTSKLLDVLKKNDITRDIYRALTNVGITGDDNCLLKKSFENNVGADVVADYNKKTANGLKIASDASYNEYTYSLCLKVETTKFRLQTLMFTDKLPTEYGPATPADKSQYFSDGYGFQASALLLKIGEETDSSETTGVANPLEDMASIIGTTWRINRNDSTNPDVQSDAVDLVIGNVDVTAAN